MGQLGGFAATRVGLAVASLGGLALLTWAAWPSADRLERAAQPPRTSNENESQPTDVQVLQPKAELLSAEMSREETSTPHAVDVGGAETQNAPTDDDYRSGRLRALKAAVLTLRDPALSTAQRIQNADLLATASVATLLDAQGAYTEQPPGQRLAVELLPGHERVFFNGRVYHVDVGDYQEFHETRRLMWSLHETTAQPKPLNASASTPHISDELLQQVLARATEAIRVVEGDMESKQIRFR